MPQPMRFRMTVTISCLFQRTDQKAGRPQLAHVHGAVSSVYCSGAGWSRIISLCAPPSAVAKHRAAHMRDASGLLPSLPCLTAEPALRKSQERNAPITGFCIVPEALTTHEIQNAWQRADTQQKLHA